MGKDNKKQGFTLVELIVSFSVLSILLAAVAVLLPSFLNQYNHVQSTSRTQTVGNTLMEMIEGQLSYATSQINLITTENGDFTVVEYNDQDGNTIDMSVLTEQFETNFGLEEDSSISSGLFILRYAELADLEDENLVTRNAIDWGYTDDFYIGNTVTAFTVTKAASEYRENVLEVSFTLTNSKNGMENTFTRLIECTNFASTTNNDIVVDGKDPSDGDDDTLFPVVDSYWPSPESFNTEGDEWNNSKMVNPGGIFKHTDNKYYVVISNTQVTKQMAADGPGEFDAGGSYHYNTCITITGTVYTYEKLSELANAGWDKPKQIIYRGDICEKDGVYYVCKVTSDGSWINTDVDNASSWYRVP